MRAFFPLTTRDWSFTPKQFARLTDSCSLGYGILSFRSTAGRRWQVSRSYEPWAYSRAPIFLAAGFLFGNPRERRRVDGTECRGGSGGTGRLPGCRNGSSEPEGKTVAASQGVSDGRHHPSQTGGDLHDARSI